MTACPRILIVDDDPSILAVLDARLTASDFQVEKAGDAAAAARILREKHVDLLVSDMKMPVKSGMELFAEIRQTLPDLPVIFLTAYGTIPDAVDAIKQGAVDYISKPFDGRDLIRKINTVLAARDASESATPLAEEDYYWGNSPGMRHLQDMVAKVAATKVNVLILGESGVGKERIAGLIHRKSSRAENPYVVVDCGSTPAGILESELFGHLKGAFTHAVKDKQGLVQVAHTGTLFLDEIGNISHDMQCRLLRFLEDGRIRQVGAVTERDVDCRVLAATNADLTTAIEAGEFRQDLYYRIKGITLNIPPLRERQEDIPALSALFLERYAAAQGLPRPRISAAAMAMLTDHAWPGNVRELKNVIEAGAVLCRDNTIRPRDLQIENLRDDAAMVSKSPAAGISEDDTFSLEASERKTLIRALKKTRGIQKAAADLLNISKRAMHYKVKKYGIDPKVFK